MKKALLYLFMVVFINVGYTQSNSSKTGIKRIIETESQTLTKNDGKKYTYTSEVNETEYNQKDDKTSRIRKTFYNGKPYKTLIVNYFYNQNGEIKYETNSVIEDSTHYTTEYFYSNNNLTEKSFQFIKNEKESRYIEVYSYDENNKLTSSNYKFYEKYIDSDSYSRNLSVESKYNKKGKIIEMDWTESDSTFKFNKYIYKWNKKGLIIKEKEYNKENKMIKVTSFKYTFDKRNNWITKMLFVDKVLVETIYREIEYYD